MPSVSISPHIEEEVLEVRFYGGDVSPYGVSIDEFTVLLKAFNASMKAMIRQDYPDLDVDDDYLNFVEVGDRSLGMRYFVNKTKDIVKRSFLTLAVTLSQGHFEHLPEDAINPLRKISTFNNKHDCAVSFGFVGLNGNATMIGDFKSITVPKYKPFKSPRTLYGELIKAGGDERPEIALRLVNGKAVTMSVSKDEVIRYKDLLYKEVKAMGTAIVSGETLMMTAFKLDKIEPYKIATLSNSISYFKEHLSLL